MNINYDISPNSKQITSDYKFVDDIKATCARNNKNKSGKAICPITTAQLSPEKTILINGLCYSLDGMKQYIIHKMMTDYGLEVEENPFVIVQEGDIPEGHFIGDHFIYELNDIYRQPITFEDRYKILRMIFDKRSSVAKSDPHRLGKYGGKRRKSRRKQKKSRRKYTKRRKI